MQSKPLQPSSQHSKLLRSIIERHGLPVIGEADWDAFSARHDHVMLLIAGDAARIAESDDLAVIFPELAKVFVEVLTPAVADKAAERAFQRKFRFSAFPALVFVRQGQYLGAIGRVRDWSDYLHEIPEILSRAPSEPPPFKLPTPPRAAATDSHEELFDGPL